MTIVTNSKKGIADDLNDYVSTFIVPTSREWFYENSSKIEMGQFSYSIYRWNILGVVDLPLLRITIKIKIAMNALNIVTIKMQFWILNALKTIKTKISPSKTLNFNKFCSWKPPQIL